MLRTSQPLLIVCTLAVLLLATSPGNRACLADQAVENQMAAATPDAPSGNQPIWPLQLRSSDATVTIYLPQVETFKGDRITGRSAVAVTRSGATNPTFGAMQFNAEVSTDRESRTVSLIAVNVTGSQFRSADAELAKVLSDTVQNGIRQTEITFSLDELLTQLEVATREKASADELKNDPPKIIFSDVPAILVIYDGPPRMMSVENSPLTRVVNTPFLVLFDASSKLYYLDGGRGWYSAADPLGPWQLADQVTKDVQAIQEKLKQSEEEPPATQPEADDGGPPPKIFTATEPTELIVTDGPPQMASIYNTNLLYVSNTDSDVFLDINTQKVYLLLAGRWCMADRMEGPWAFVPSDKLPADFAKIPPESPKAGVLPCVAGTEPAEEAVLDAMIPQTATIDRSAPGPTVTYDGEPRFESIQQPAISYAVNTPDSVLKVNGGYYCCDAGVWYQSAAATGPWVVCTSVPQVIYSIPPSCPIYPVKYVYVYNYTPAVVYVGYTPGYMGYYVYRGTVVYGTGFIYRGWYGRYYYPRPVTYGFGVAYNPYTGNWGFRVGVAGPNGWFAFGTGGTAWGGRGFAVGVRWGPGSGWWGSGGYHRHNNININIKTGDIDRSRNINIGDRNRSTSISDRSRNIYANRPDNGKGVYTRDRTTERTGDARARGLQGRSIADRPARQPERNLFADKNGDVLRRNMDGWETRNRANTQQQRTANQRTDSPRSAQPPNLRQQRPDLDRQLQARDRGQQRSQDFQQYRSQVQNPGGANRPQRNMPAAGNRGPGQSGAAQRGAGGRRGGGG